MEVHLHTFLTSGLDGVSDQLRPSLSIVPEQKPLVLVAFPRAPLDTAEKRENLYSPLPRIIMHKAIHDTTDSLLGNRLFNNVINMWRHGCK
jgi:hypothetical protein